MTPSLPRKCSTTELRGHIPVSPAVVHEATVWSGRRDSNPRPIAWKAITLPTELLPLSTVCEKLESVLSRSLVWRGQDSNLRSPEGRRVYSPLPLSTRPPLLIAIGEFPIPVRPAVSLLPVHPTFLESSLIAREDTGSATLYALGRTDSNRKWDRLGRPVAAPRPGGEGRESWRRESNPQPTDYKSVALPLSYASSEACPPGERVQEEHYHNSALRQSEVGDGHFEAGRGRGMRGGFVLWVSKWRGLKCKGGTIVPFTE